MSDSQGQGTPLQAYAKPFGEVCYGCGANNPRGLRIESHWAGDEAVCTWQPAAYHLAAPGLLNGGVIATLMDCHCACAAIAAAYRAEGRAPGSAPEIVMVTGSLHVDFLKPTPIAGPVRLRARVAELTGRKAVLDCSLWAGESETARGQVVMIRPKAGSI